MTMMASATAGNPYENYDNNEIEQDLIDPDDGSLNLPAYIVMLTKGSSASEYQRFGRSATVQL